MPDEHNIAPGTAGFQHHGSEASDCHICGEALAGQATALCGVCDRPFHLSSRRDEAGEDCGDVQLNEQYLAMDFACNECLGRMPRSADEEPPVASGH